MASSSSSSNRKEKVARVTRNATSSGWISDEEIRGNFLYLDVQLFKKEGFLFQEWIAYRGLTHFFQMKGNCFLDLVEVFYTNLSVVNGAIHSRVKGVNITIDDNVWSNIVGLKAEGLASHIRDSKSNMWLTKRAIYVKCLRYSGRYTMDKQYLHDGLNKEEKIIAYVLTWLLLPGRLNEDRMSIEDVFLLNAIKTKIPTNCITVLKDHMIAVGDDYAHKLPYGVCINKVLELQGIYVSEEEGIVWKRSQEISIPSLSSIGLKRTENGWFFTNEQTIGSPPTHDEDHTEDSDDEDSMESS